MIPSSWREAFREQKQIAKLLDAELRLHIRRAPNGWYTETRVKGEDSFYQKIETGTVSSFERLEDFVGALIVVPLPTDLPTALAFVERFADVAYRKPVNDEVATIRAIEFPFNDIRIYATLRPDDGLPPRPLDKVVFEIQVKTFFQHAWSTATHDLVYKHERFSWPRSRVAAQVKAILEHAELSIAALDELESSPALPQTGMPESDLTAYLDVLRANWTDDDLPGNKKRLTETVRSLCVAIGLEPQPLADLLARGREALDGHPDGWTPYQCIVDYASRFRLEELRKALRRSTGQPAVIHVTPDVLLRTGLSIKQAVRARL